MLAGRDAPATISMAREARPMFSALDQDSPLFLPTFFQYHFSLLFL
jgi:hypothetical protein